MKTRFPLPHFQRPGITAFMLLVFAGNAVAQSAYVPKAVDINKADTTVWIALPGIGSKLATRIVNYREKLHGFVSVEQVAEVYGLSDSVFQKIKPMLYITQGIDKININTATPDQLKTPYINYNVANVIYQYRLQHGAYQTLEDLKKLMLIDEALYVKITPYLSVK